MTCDSSVLPNAHVGLYLRASENPQITPLLHPTVLDEDSALYRSVVQTVVDLRQLFPASQCSPPRRSSRSCGQRAVARAKRCECLPCGLRPQAAARVMPGGGLYVREGDTGLALVVVHLLSSTGCNRSPSDWGRCASTRSSTPALASSGFGVLQESVYVRPLSRTSTVLA